MVALTDFAVALEVATSDTPRSASPSYTDLSTFVRAGSPLEFTRGRENEQAQQAQPGNGQWEFKNADGRFTMGNLASPYAPLKIRRPCRAKITYSGTTYPVWQGFIDTWGNRRDQTLGVARMVASDRLARAGKIKLPALLPGEILYDAPTGYWPLSDASGSQSAGDVTGAVVSPLTVQSIGSTGSLDFGVGATPGPDDGTVAAFTRGSSTSGKYLTTTSATNFGSSGAYTLEAWIKTTNTAPTLAGVVRLSNAARQDLTIYVSGGNLNGSVGGPIADGTWHHVAVTIDGSGYSMYLDGVLFGTGAGSTNLYTQLDVGAYVEPFDGQIAHVAVTASRLSGARIAAHANAGLTAFAGETSDARFSRLCRIAGIPSSQYAVSGTGASTMGRQPTRDVALLDALAQVAKVEAGYVYVTAAGVLRFSVRADRYDTPVGLTLDASKPGHVGTGFETITDDSLLINDATVTRNGGAVQRVVDQTSVNDYDTHDTSDTVYTDTDATARGIAELQIFTNGTPQPRSSTIEVDLIAFANSGGNVANLLSADIGTHLQVINVPTDTVATRLDLFIEGISFRVDRDTIVVTLRTSPFGQFGSFATFDTSRFGWGDGVCTASALTSSGTSVTLTWTGGQAFSTSAGDYPMDISIGGERCTVSSAPAGSSSPQTVTIVRGVAPTIARAHTAGDAVEVWDCWRYAF